MGVTVSRILRGLRREGLGKRFRRYLRRFTGAQKLVVCRMPPCAPAIARKHEIVELDTVAAAGASVPWQTEEVESRQAFGARLFALVADSHFVSFAWVSVQQEFRAEEIRKTLRSETPVVWIWDCVTPPENRGRGYYPELICELAVRLGQEQAIIFVRSENVPSVRGIAKAGFQPWMEIAVTKWSARISYLSSFSGKLTLSL